MLHLKYVLKNLAGMKNQSGLTISCVGVFADSGSESGSHKAGVGGVRGSGGHKSGGGSDGKPTRVRTVLNEKQLHTLRTCYAANPRPDALMKEQLVEMTGLSPRVIRVWFQNKRCKDKKKTIALKQQMQEKVKIYTMFGRVERRIYGTRVSSETSLFCEGKRSKGPCITK